MTDATALFTAKTPPGLFTAKAPSPYATLGSSGDSGAISGGLLRPGSIDQATFLQMLQQEQQNRQAAGVGGKPVAMPSQSFQTTNVPTLSSAQFARLVGGANADPGLAANPVEAPAGDPQATAATQTQLQSQVQAQLLAQARAAAPAGPSLKLSGTAASRDAKPETSGQAAPDSDTPTISRAVAPVVGADEMPTISRKSAPVLEAAATASPDKKPAASDTETETESKTEGDPVVHLKSPPDKDQQKDLRMRNKRWVVDETPGARTLFFGEDGEFGWDDFLDMINPLQHIPGIAQLYRAVTGDKINGAANLLGAIPFGPLGGVGLIASVADLAVKDTTGDDIGGNLVAAIFGRDDKATPGTSVPADMADAGEGEPAAAPAGTVQTASRFTLADTSQMHADCRG